MIFNSIRWRLQLWHGLILVAVLTGFGVTAYQVARDNQLRAIDHDLEQQLEMTMRPRPPEGPPPAPMRFDPTDFRERMRRSVESGAASEQARMKGVYIVWWKEDGSLLARSPGAPLDVPIPMRDNAAAVPQRPGPPFRTLSRMRGSDREVMRLMPFGDWLLAGRSITQDLEDMRRLELWMLAAGAGILLIGLAGGSWLSARAIRPIEDISATAQRIAGGDLSQRINVADTESELGRLAGVLNSTFARLEASFAQQARFTADASHELRTPVTVILSQTQTSLARERAAEDYREALEACQRAAQRMKRLITSLLELSRLDAGQEPMRREQFDLARVARECLELMRPLAAEREIRLDSDLNPAHCFGDAEHMGQLIANLMSNAIQYSSDGGTVRVTTRMNGGVQLTVSDDGPGIAAEDLPHIFERFYRADKSRSNAQGRTGLGLAISKAIADAHGGVISVESEPGSGATFRLRLPEST